MSTLFKKLEKWLAPCWALLIFVASIMPNSDISIDSNMLFPHADKIVHFIMYFFLQVLCMRHNGILNLKNKTTLIFGLVIFYGIFLELVQGYFLVDRFFENYDIIANITGAFIGIVFFNFIKS